MKSEKEIPDMIMQPYKGKGDTWPKILAYNNQRYGAKRAMRYKHYGIWQPVTWKDYYLNVKYLALGLLHLGFQPEDKLLIIGDNAPEWYYAELAAQANHGISIGVYPDLTPAELKYIAENSDAAFAVVEDQEQVDKILEIKNDLPLLKNIIYWNYKGLASYDHPDLIGIKQVYQSGKKYEKDHPYIFEENVQKGNGDDICALVYTSGTTEAPKGAIHSFNTMRAGAEFYLNLDPWYKDDNIIPYRPPAWMTGQWFGIGCHLLSASILNFTEASETQQHDTKETGPSIVFYGARQWENLAASVYARMFSADRLKRFTFSKLMPVAYKIADLHYKKQNANLYHKLVYSLANIILYKPIKNDLGFKNARICYSTEAMISPDACRFYHALNLPLKSLYATTEGGALTGAYNNDICADSVGLAHQGTDIKITDDGELIYKQAGIFVGYYKDPDKTAQVLRDGWFYSGDCCTIREDGHVVFVERLKDLVELANGNKLAPQSIESRLRFSPYIMDAWVLAGDDKSFASAIIIINNNNVSRWAGQNQISFSSFAELSQKPEVYELVKKDIERINNSLPPGSHIKKYVNLHKTFNPNEDELTRSRKLRRGVLEKRYSEIINAIYSNKAEVPIKAQISREGRTVTITTNLYIKSIDGSSL